MSSSHQRSSSSTQGVPSLVAERSVSSDDRGGGLLKTATMMTPSPPDSAYLKPSNLHQKRRPSDILADTLRAQTSLAVAEAVAKKKTSGGYMHCPSSSSKQRAPKSVRFPLDVDLQEAVREGDGAALRKMVRTYGRAVLKVRDPQGHPLPVMAVRENQPGALQLLIEEGCDLTATDRRGHTALHTAAEDDAIEMARIIVEAVQKAGSCHANLANFKTDKGQRPIDLCISVEMADLLMHADLEHFLGDLEEIWAHNVIGTDITVSNSGDGNDSSSKTVKSQESPKEEHLLHIVGGVSHEKAKKYICDFHSINGFSLLHLAAWKNYSRLGFYLAEEELISLEVVDQNNWTPLHTAVAHSSVDMTLLLIELGANVQAENCEGQTPFFLAEDELILCILADAAEATSDMSSVSSGSETLSE